MQHVVVAQKGLKMQSNGNLIGVSDAARMLELAEPTVRLAANKGRIACVRDSAGRRLFRLADLRAYKRALKRRRSESVRRAVQVA